MRQSDTADFIRQSAFGKPKQWGTVIAWFCIRFYIVVDKFFRLSCQLAGNGIPEASCLFRWPYINMFGEIIFITADNFLLNGSYRIKFFFFCKSKHYFRHTANIKIIFKIFWQIIFNQSGKARLFFFYRGYQLLFIQGSQKFRKCHWIQREVISLPNRERFVMVQRNSKKTASRHYVIFRSFFIEIL